MTSPLLRRPSPIPSKLAQVARTYPLDSIPVLTMLAASAWLVFAPACNLPPATVNGIVHGALTFACSTVQPFIPSKDAALASTICTDATIAADEIGKVIESVIEAPPPGVRLIHPQGDVAARPVTCAGGVVAMVPAGIQERVQRAMNDREECKR